MTNQRFGPLAWLGVALVVAISLSVALGVLSFSTYGVSYGRMGSGAWGWGVLMMAVPAAFLIVILLAALGGLREPQISPAGPVPTPAPLEILEHRYARGELSREDYMRIRDDLFHDPAHS